MMSRLRALAPLLLLLLGSAAQARTYWVSPSGVSGAAGNDSLSTPTTLAWFNANAVAGDVCRFKSGTYADPVQPARDGNASSRIRYYGFANDPTAVIVSNIRFGYAHGNYSTVRWVTCLNGATGLYEAAGMEATDDSIAACRIYGQSSAFGIQAMRSVVDSMVISGTITAAGQNHLINLAGERNHNNGAIGQWSIGSLNNRLTNSTLSVTLNTPGDIHVIMVSAAGYNVIQNNTINVNVQNVSGYFFGMEMYEGYSNQIIGNTWNFTMNGPAAGSRGVWCHRDSSTYNRYVSNRVTVSGSGGDLSFMLSNGGSFPNTTGHNYYGNNYIDDRSPQSGTGVFWYYDGLRSDTLEYNTIVTSGTRPLLNVVSNQQVDGLVSRHNTYVTSGANAIDLAPATAVNNPRFSSDVFYCRAANGAGAENLRVPAGVRLDSLGVIFSPSGTASRAIYVAGADGAPGSGGNYGLSGRAVWGSPRFVDSTATSFDGRLLNGGAAVNAGFTDGFAGAYPFATGGDITAPSTINDLRTSLPTLNSLLLSWTSPGDDGLVGTATAYDLRYSLSPITSGNFGSAAVATSLPLPSIAGTPQSVAVMGLNPGATYYFAIRTRDDAGNWSAMSNVPTGTTTADTIPPAAVTDLSPGP